MTRLDDKVFVTQTDTTIGFVSQDATRLTTIKQRPPHKSYIRTIPSLKTLKTHTRIPAIYKNRVRRATKTTFIMPNGNSYRVVNDREHLLLLERLNWAYSTSANPSGEDYNIEFANSNADIIISMPKTQYKKASTIVRLGGKVIRKVR